MFTIADNIEFPNHALQITSNFQIHIKGVEA